jgi:hypothetical protein
MIINVDIYIELKHQVLYKSIKKLKHFFILKWREYKTNFLCVWGWGWGWGHCCWSFDASME